MLRPVGRPGPAKGPVDPIVGSAGQLVLKAVGVLVVVMVVVVIVVVARFVLCEPR